MKVKELIKILMSMEGSEDLRVVIGSEIIGQATELEEVSEERFIPEAYYKGLAGDIIDQDYIERYVKGERVIMLMPHQF